MDFIMSKIKISLFFFCLKITQYVQASDHWKPMPLALDTREMVLTQGLIENIGYSYEKSINKTLNNYGLEFKPFDEALTPIKEHLMKLLNQGCIVRVLEGAGGCGRFMIEVIEGLKESGVNTDNLLYYFSDLEPNHVRIAQHFAASRLSGLSGQIFFQNEGNEGIENILKHEKEGTYDIIIANNLLHFLAPVKIISLLQDIHEKIKSCGVVFFTMMAPFYNEYKDYINSRLNLTELCNFYVPGDEIDRQRVLSKIQSNHEFLFPGYLANRPYDEGRSQINYFTSQNNQMLFLSTGFNTIETMEFSGEVDDCFCSSKKRFVFFKLEKNSQLVPDWQKVQRQAQEEEDLSQTSYPEFDITSFRSLWEDYLSILAGHRVTIRGQMHF